MKYIEIPIQDAIDIFGKEDVDFMRHNVPCTKVIVNEVTFKRQIDNGINKDIKSYPIHEYDATLQLMQSPEWYIEPSSPVED